MTLRDPNGEDIDTLLLRAEERFVANELTVDGKPSTVKPNRQTLRETILPLLLWCRRNHPKGVRGLVGIVGPPGTGKSTLMAWLSATARLLEFEEFAFIGLDGYHLPNAVLDGRTGSGPDGAPISMRLLKGTPESFDSQKLLDDLQRLRETRTEDHVPAYSRVLHEPIPDAIHIPAQTEWIFVEGNFLFLDELPWRDIRDVFDRKVYLDITEAEARKRLAKRHASAGRSAEWIEAHYCRTDEPNGQRVRQTKCFADIVIR